MSDMNSIKLECGRIYDPKTDGSVRCEQHTCEDIAKCMGNVEDALLSKPLQQSQQEDILVRRRKECLRAIQENLSFAELMENIKKL